MIRYKFSLKLKESNDSYSFTLDLQPSQENNPEKVFTQEIREQIRDTFQKQSSCRIDDINLNRIIKTWLQDIKEGYRDSQITLDLPLLIESQIEQLNESGNQEIPPLVYPDLTGIEPQIGALPPLIFH